MSIDPALVSAVALVALIVALLGWYAVLARKGYFDSLDMEDE